MSKTFKGKFHELHVDISLSEGGDPEWLLQEIIEQFRLEIVRFQPIGPAGGNSFIVFKGHREDLEAFLEKFYFAGAAEDMEIEDAKNEWIFESDSDELEVMYDDRFVTTENGTYKRKFVAMDGSPIYN